MELSLTREQKDYLNAHGPLNAPTLQRVYKKSVEDQQEMLKRAEKIRDQRAKKK
ncbi:MAG: hypothetical protein JWN01_49 [Patescibacteria group bacterium]|nr:hypothetical protein [Patescibacteria group bacterium]